MGSLRLLVGLVLYLSSFSFAAIDLEAVYGTAGKFQWAKGKWEVTESPYDAAISVGSVTQRQNQRHLIQQLEALLQGQQPFTHAAASNSDLYKITLAQDLELIPNDINNKILAGTDIVVKKYDTNSGKILSNFMIEFWTYAKLQAGGAEHAHVLKALAYAWSIKNGKVGDAYLILPHAAGGTLRGFIERMVEAKVYATRRELLAIHFLDAGFDAISFLHSKGVVSHDMKPDNVLLINAVDPITCTPTDLKNAVRVFDFDATRSTTLPFDETNSDDWFDGVVSTKAWTFLETTATIFDPQFNVANLFTHDYLSNKQVSKSWIPAQFHTNVVDQHVKTYTRLVMANQLAELTVRPTSFLSMKKWDVYALGLTTLNIVHGTSVDRTSANLQHASLWNVVHKLLLVTPNDARLLALKQTLTNAYTRNTFTAGPLEYSWLIDYLSNDPSLPACGAVTKPYGEYPIECASVGLKDAKLQFVELSDGDYAPFLKETWDQMEAGTLGVAEGKRLLQCVEAGLMIKDINTAITTLSVASQKLILPLVNFHKSERPSKYTSWVQLKNAAVGDLTSLTTAAAIPPVPTLPTIGPTRQGILSPTRAPATPAAALIRNVKSKFQIWKNAGSNPDQMPTPATIWP